MDSHSLRVLEFEAVRLKLVEQATCTLGQERARAVEPSWREAEVRAWQSETSEAVRLLDSSAGVPFGGIHDIRTAVQAAGLGGMLEPSVLLLVADTLSGGRKLRAYLLQREEQAPRLAGWGRRVGEFPQVEQEIHEAIGENAEVRDDASPTLARLRRELRAIRARMTERLHSILRNSSYRDMIQDPLITTRDGRFCIPVKAEYRVQFGGLVHDQSTSGATVFMEPNSVVEMGNELRQVEIRERQEVERILRELTAAVGRHAEEIRFALEALGELDLIFARARLAQTMDAVEPEIDDNGYLALRRARHPLLTGAVVPIDVDLGREHTVLIITGPNTGGKTVTLKTVGLLALMAQSGLHVPAHEGSVLPVFHGIYADIGDEQSIQQSLSTFSGHIVNIARILGEVDKAGARSLVLLDEVGAGTDPTEGAALAKAILGRLRERGARTIATTHYGELKEFAYSTEGVENASVEFDLETLRPTYRLLTGIPGTSNAFTIAGRLGLPQPVVEAARGLIGTDQAVLSDVIQRLTEDQRSTESGLRRATKAASDVEAQRDRYERELKQLKADRADTLERARRQADEIVRGARREVDRVREELKRLEKQARTVLEEPAGGPALEKVRGRLADVAGRVDRRAEAVARSHSRKAPPPEEPLEPAMDLDTRPPVVGDQVWIPGVNQRGTLLAELAGGKAQVQIGSMRTTVPADTLKRIRSPKPAARPAPSLSGLDSSARLRARANIAPEVDLRGMRAEEAMERLDEYVDQACLAGLSPFRVIHGRGTGAVKRTVWEFLKSHPGVSGCRHPAEDEGGTGVTVAELRE